MFKLASLFVDVVAKTDSAEGNLDRLKGKLSGMGGALKGAALATAAGAIAAAAAGAGVAMVHALRAAGDLNETLSKTREVFGKSAGDVENLADHMADAFGGDRTAILDAASNFGLIAQGAGMAEGAAADFSIELTKLADDASSFYNTDLPTALEKIRAGLTGEAEPLKAFGVFLTEAAVKLKAVELGLSTGKGELSEQTKVMARAAIITASLSKASGDHARTSGGLNNQWKEATGRISNMSTALGGFLSGPAAATLRTFNGLVAGAGAFKDMLGLVSAGILQAGADAAGAGGTMAALIDPERAAKGFEAAAIVGKSTGPSGASLDKQKAIADAAAEAAKLKGMKAAALAEIAADEAKARQERFTEDVRYEARIAAVRAYHAKDDARIKAENFEAFAAAAGGTGRDMATRVTAVDLEGGRRKAEGLISLAKDKAGQLVGMAGGLRGNALAAAGAVAGRLGAAGEDVAARKARLFASGGVSDAAGYARERQNDLLQNAGPERERLELAKSSDKTLSQILAAVSKNTVQLVASQFR